MGFIKALVFDLDDTLYDCNYTNNTASIEAVCRYAAKELLPMTEQEIRQAFDSARESIKADMLGDEAAQHNRMLYFQRTMELLGLPPVSAALEMYEFFWTDFLQRIHPYPGAARLLEQWRRQGGKVAICTDMTVHIQHRKLRSLGLDGLIDVLVTSEEVGAEKPDQAVYRRVSDKLQMAPKDLVFIGDSLVKDVLGPMSSGMHAIWYVDAMTAGSPSDEQEQLALERHVARAEDYESLGQLLGISQAGK